MNTYQGQQMQEIITQSGVVIPFVTYIAYIIISITLTVWVARTLAKNGRHLLVRTFGEEQLADSVNHLLVVGFYLLNFGYASLTLKMGIRPNDPVQGIEELSVKIGAVLVVLGMLHFFNLYIFSRISARTSLRNALPPVSPSERVR